MEFLLLIMTDFLSFGVSNYIGEHLLFLRGFGKLGSTLFLTIAWLGGLNEFNRLFTFKFLSPLSLVVNWIGRLFCLLPDLTEVDFLPLWTLFSIDKNVWLCMTDDEPIPVPMLAICTCSFSIIFPFKISSFFRFARSIVFKYSWIS